jgi:hypothetical protein
LDQLPPRHRAEALRQLGAGEPAEPDAARKRIVAQGEVIAPAGTGQPARPFQRIRQSTKPLLNKLETEYFNRIKDLYPNYPPVRAQAKTFRLCNGVRFTPDLSCSIWPVDGGAARETCWEIKGVQMWDDAVVKAKMAAHEFPEICWRFVWKNKDGKWCEQILLP